MTNFEKYKSVAERISAHEAFCEKQPTCSDCPCNDTEGCMFNWLKLEVEEEKEEDEIEPCPFCGEECACGGGYVECLNDNCCYSSGHRKSDAEAIAAHNRFVRAVKAAKEGATK